MWWLFGLVGAVVYVVMLFTLGILSIRNRHVILFLLGFALPLFWIVGAMWAPAGERAQPA
jgi:hypothetical protein